MSTAIGCLCVALLHFLLNSSRLPCLLLIMCSFVTVFCNCDCGCVCVWVCVCVCVVCMSGEEGERRDWIREIGKVGREREEFGKEWRSEGLEN